MPFEGRFGTEDDGRDNTYTGSGVGRTLPSGTGSECVGWDAVEALLVFRTSVRFVYQGWVRG